MPENPRPTPGFLLRLARGLVPIALALGIVYATAAQTRRNPLLAVAILILCGICLWLGRPWMKAILITKWIGLCLAAYVMVNLALVALSVAATPMPFLFLLVPLAAYDLFVAQPWKGRFARARAERRGIPD